MRKIQQIVKWYEVSEKDIVSAEQRIGFSFPKDLKTIYKKYGYGFVNNQVGAINRIIDPITCADIRLREDFYEFDPDLELYSSFEKDKLLFFEVNEGVYISIGFDDGKIYYLNEVIGNDIFEFLFDVSENPDYWCK